MIKGFEEMRRDGFKVDDYFVSFPPGDFVQEDESGNLSVLVDIFKIDSNNKMQKTTSEEITPELETKIGAYINEILVRAIEDAEKEFKDGETKGS